MIQIQCQPPLGACDQGKNYDLTYIKVIEGGNADGRGCIVIWERR